MKTPVNANALTDPVLAAARSDEEWVALHVPRFKKAHPRFEAYEVFLEAVLKEAAGRLAPLSIVNARAKKLASFAEKILRKRQLYQDPKDPLPPDPLVRMTDLCGGRVIVQTAKQVERMCEFIKSAFDIDWPNSEDASRRLKPTEFGYRSVHYIVIPNPVKLRAAGISTSVPPSIKGLKAEVQVRTLLEHASADIGHDTLYKAAMKVPNPIKRQFAALAAVLEGADVEFGRLLTSLDELKSNFGAWHLPDEVKSEMNRLRIVLRCDPRNESLAVKIGQLALSVGDHPAALDVLKPFRAGGGASVQRIFGLALTEMHWDAPVSEGFREGMQHLSAACEQSQPDAETLCALAECWAHRGNDDQAAELFRKAIVIDPTEPLNFCRFLEFEVARQRSDEILHLTEPMIHRTMERCRKEIEAGINLPTAWSCLSIFQLVTGQPLPALTSLAQVMNLCGKPQDAAATPQPCAAGRTLRRLRETVHHLSCLRGKIEGFGAFERLLLLALVVTVKDKPAMADLREIVRNGERSRHLSRKDEIVILSGGCAPAVQPAINAFKPELRKALEGTRKVLISGGTRAGISGLAGYVAALNCKNLRAYGYMPEFAPGGIQADRRRYTLVLQTKGMKDFTPLDPLEGWTDIILAGIEARTVTLISFAGGHISRIEYAVALALGARVAVIESSQVPPDRQFNDPLWQDHPRLMRLPLDGMTLRAFLQMDQKPLTDRKKQHLEKAARMAHEKYRQNVKPQEPSLQPWEDLVDALKLSNYLQVDYWERVLHEHGLGVRPLTRADAKQPPLDMEKAVGAKGIARLAEMEHGRWNIERIANGWRYAEKKDVAARLSPWLIPWKDVPPEIQQYDIDAIRNLPEALRKAKLELYKMEQ